MVPNGIATPQAWVYLAPRPPRRVEVELLGILAVSYVTRPADRRGFAKSMSAQGSSPLPASGSTASVVASKAFALDEQ
jgi:hypothetical protein